jgi:MFS family permease
LGGKTRDPSDPEGPDVIATYRQLLSLTGPAYVVVAFFGRLPLAMSQLGTLLLVADSTGSYGAGGAGAGALAVANALGAPVAGSLADRLGQRPVVLVQSLAGACGLVTLVAVSAAGAPWGLQALVAALAGLALPQVGPLARVRWRPITARRAADVEGGHDRLMDAAFSYEGAADETSFVLGPALVGLAVALVSPAAALVVAAAVLAVFGSLFALDATARLAHSAPAGVDEIRARLLSAALVLLAAAQFLIGVVFGSSQTGTTVLATAAGEPGLTGLLHALLGIGSAAAGLALTLLSGRVAHEVRLLAFSALLLVLSLPLLAVDSLATLAVVLLVLGVAVAPYMITVFALAERITHQRRVGAAMTVLAGTTGLGYAAGSSIAGRLADWSGHTPAYAVTVGAAVLAVLLAASGLSVLGRAQRPLVSQSPSIVACP